MSTVVDSNKYIINGSTLSEIGDAVKEQMPNQYETVTKDVACYKQATSAYSSGSTMLTLTEETIQEWYQNTLPSPITAVKIINTSRNGYNSYVKVNGNNKYFTLNETQTYSLPITIYGDGYSSPYGSSDPGRFTYEIYPLNGDNYLSWDSNYYYPSSSRDYTAHLYKKEISYERLLPKTNCLVSEIAQRIASFPSLSGAQVDFIKMYSKGTRSGASEGTNLLTTMGIKDISDIYYIIGYNDYQSTFPKGFVYLDMVNNPNPVSTSTYGGQTINYYQFYYLPQTSSSSGQNPEAKPYVSWAYWKSENCFLNSTYYTQGLATDSNNYPAFVMVIHKQVSSS